MTAAQTFGTTPMTAEESAAFDAHIASVIASQPELGPPEDFANYPDPRDDPAFEPTPAGWRPGDPRTSIERRGPSYLVTSEPLGLSMVFREVRTDRDLSADVSFAVGDRHLFRTTSTLSLVGRDKLAKTAAEFGLLEGHRTRQAVFAAVEAVLSAEENVGLPTDLRTADLSLPAGGVHVARPLWPTGSVVVVSPGDSGKSTLARALAVSLASGRPVIPGVEPIGGCRPVLYVAGEDPVAYWHSRSVEAICRGAGIERSAIREPIELFDARGRPLHRIVRALAERAADYGAIVLDSQQALLPQADASGGIRDRDSLFWNAVDQLERPTFIIAHPNRSDARGWQKADDGRIAGSEVNRDRARMAWRMSWTDEPAVVGTSFRRYTLTNTKNNHGPREDSLSFAAQWTYGFDGDPGSLMFLPSEEIRTGLGLSPEMSATLQQYEAGNTTPAPLAKALGIGIQTAKSRLRLLRERGLIGGSQHE